MDFNTETITILRRKGDSWPDTLQSPPEMCKESVFELPILVVSRKVV